MPLVAPRALHGLYFFCEPISEGSFGVLFIAIHALTRRKVAIKILEKRKLGSEFFRVRNEIEALKQLNHKYIYKLYQVVETDSCFYLVLEYVPGGELFDYILQKEHLSEAEARVIFRQIVSAIGYIHSRGFAHRDLKPDDNLMSGNRVQNSTNNMLDTFCGSYAYAAPEVLANKEYSGSAADLWSLGVILYALLCGCLPFEPDKPEELTHKIKLICVDPKKRMKMEEVRWHPWMVDGFMGHPVDLDEERLPLIPLNWRIVSEISFYTRIPKVEVARMLLKLPFDYIMATYMIMVSTLEEDAIFIHLQRRPRPELANPMPLRAPLKPASQFDTTPSTAPPAATPLNITQVLQKILPPPLPVPHTPLAVQSSHTSLPPSLVGPSGDGDEMPGEGLPDSVTAKQLFLSKSPKSLGSLSQSTWSENSSALVTTELDKENCITQKPEPPTPEVTPGYHKSSLVVCGGTTAISPSRSLDSRFTCGSNKDRYVATISAATYSSNVTSSVSSIASGLSHDLASASLGLDDRSNLSSSEARQQPQQHYWPSEKNSGGSSFLPMPGNTTGVSSGSNLSGSGLGSGVRVPTTATSRMPGVGPNWRPLGRLRGVLTPKKCAPDGRLMTEHLRKVRHLNNVILVRNDLSPGQVFDQLATTLKAQAIRFTLKGSGFLCVFANDWGKTVLSFELELVYVSSRAAEAASAATSGDAVGGGGGVNAAVSIRRRLTIKPKVAAHASSKQQQQQPTSSPVRPTVTVSVSRDSSNTGSQGRGQPAEGQNPHLLGIKMKRLKGDAFMYTSLCRTILEAAQIKDCSEK